MRPLTWTLIKDSSSVVEAMLNNPSGTGENFFLGFCGENGCTAQAVRRRGSIPVALFPESAPQET